MFPHNGVYMAIRQAPFAMSGPPTGYGPMRSRRSQVGVELQVASLPVSVQELYKYGDHNCVVGGALTIEEQEAARIPACDNAGQPGIQSSGAESR